MALIDCLDSAKDQLRTMLRNWCTEVNKRKSLHIHSKNEEIVNSEVDKEGERFSILEEE